MKMYYIKDKVELYISANSIMEKHNINFEHAVFIVKKIESLFKNTAEVHINFIDAYISKWIESGASLDI